MKLSEFVKDSLQEIGNIGSSHSASTLSECLGPKISLSPPEVEEKKGEDLVREVGEEGTFASAFSIGDKITGTIIFFFPLRGALEVGRGMGNPSSAEELDEVIQKVGSKMASSFVGSIAEFFGVEVEASPPELEQEGVDSMSELLGALGIGRSGALFFNTALVDSDFTYCHLYLHLNREDVEKLMGTEVDVQGFDGDMKFSDVLGSFEEVYEVEEKVNGLIEHLSIPHPARREFLRSQALGGFKKDRLKALLEKSLESSGIGKGIYLASEEPLRLSLHVEECNVCQMVPGGQCHTTTTALGRMFMENLGIGASIEEKECRNSGGSECMHEITLEQIDVFSMMTLPRDTEIAELIRAGHARVRELAEQAGVEEDVVRETLHLLEYYGIAQGGEEWSLTQLGEIFLNFTRSLSIGEEEMPEGWDDIGRIEEEIQKEKERGEEGGEAVELPPWEL